MSLAHELEVLEVLFDLCKVHFQIIVLCELYAGELVLCIEQE